MVQYTEGCLHLQSKQLTLWLHFAVHHEDCDSSHYFYSPKCNWMFLEFVGQFNIMHRKRNLMLLMWSNRISFIVLTRSLAIFDSHSAAASWADWALHNALFLNGCEVAIHTQQFKIWMLWIQMSLSIAGNNQSAIYKMAKIINLI